MATPKITNKTPKLSDTAKNALRNQRRRLAGEQSDVAARRAMEARSVLSRVTKPVAVTAPQPKRKVDPTVMAFQKGVIPRTSAVLASEGLHVRVKVDLSANAGKYAYTDFTSISVGYPVAGVTDLDVAEVAAILRGTVYHEGGHCRWTEKPDDMIRRYHSEVVDEAKKAVVAEMWGKQKKLLHYAWNLAEDQRMEMLVVEDSPRKAAYFAPMVIDMVIDYRKTLTSTADTEATYNRIMDYFVNEGILTQEQRDARPFNAQVAEQQRVAGYPLIAWRRYLPRDLRLTMRAAFIAAWGRATTVKIERLILTYVKAANVEVAVDALVELAPLLREVMVPPTDHEEMADTWHARTRKPERQGAQMDDAEDEYGENEDEGDDAEGDDEGGEGGEGEGGEGDSDLDGDVDEALRQTGAASPKPDPSSKPQPQPGMGGDDSEGDEDSPTKGSGKSDDEDDEGDDEGDGDDQDGDGNEEECDASHGNAAGNAAGKHDPQGLDEMLNQAKADAEAERNSDSALRGDVEAFNHAMYEGATGSQLEPYTTVPTDNAMVIAEAQNMARDMVQAFQEVNTEHLPTWQEQQTRGVINVGRYMTRQPGDREFFRCWADEVVPGRNLAVSVLLDYSGSMSGHTASLSATAYAMKSACDELGLPCTVVLWDHDATVLWDGKDRAEFVPVIDANGGTSPRVALDDLPFHRFDKEAHIVLVMTDGEFSARDNWLNEYRTEGTYFIGAVFGRASNPRAEATMAEMGFDRYATMDSLTPLVSMLEASIIDMSQATH